MHVLLLLLVIVAVRGEPTGVIFKVDPNITIAAHDNAVKSGYPSVYLVKNCGAGPGAAIDWKVEDCLTLNNECVLAGGSPQRRYEFEFVPKNNITSVGVGFTLSLSERKLKVFATTLPDSTEPVEGLKGYTIRGSFGFSEALKGKIVTVEHRVYRVIDKLYYEEACGESDFLVV